MSKYAKVLRPYLDALAQRVPAPGGGSLACLVLCLGLSLMEKAMRYSLTQTRLRRRESIARDRRLRRFIKAARALKAGVYPGIDRDAVLFGKIMKTRSRRRSGYIRQSEQLIVSVARAADKAFSLAKKAESDIKRNIRSDFYIGRDCLSVSLRGCLFNAQANAALFAIRSRSSGRIKKLLRAWQK